MFADDIDVERRTVEDWRYTANRWPNERRKEGVSFTVHRILASVVDENERWAADHARAHHDRSRPRCAGDRHHPPRPRRAGPAAG
ncbi:DUF6192 family protein [Streptomyces sp. NPDC086787]|uniref:DUF6192 family protein n=1 Tax=Streptomyces sp. NPDC086787 TaxID=3365759 RepID=UPI003805A9AA